MTFQPYLKRGNHRLWVRVHQEKYLHIINLQAWRLSLCYMEEFDKNEENDIKIDGEEPNMQSFCPLIWINLALRVFMNN
jgi:hypothetical protein